MKKVILTMFLVISFFSFISIKVHAVNTQIVEGNSPNFNEQFDQSEQTCDGDESVLGNPNDENSVAWLLNKGLKYSTIAGMLAVIVFSTFDFVGVIINGSDEAMAKAWKKLGLRMFFALLLFFVPTITNALLDLFGLTSQSTCGIEQ